MELKQNTGTFGYTESRFSFFLSFFLSFFFSFFIIFLFNLPQLESKRHVLDDAVGTSVCFVLFCFVFFATRSFFFLFVNKKKYHSKSKQQNGRSDRIRRLTNKTLEGKLDKQLDRRLSLNWLISVKRIKSNSVGGKILSLGNRIEDTHEKKKTRKKLRNYPKTSSTTTATTTTTTTTTTTKRFIFFFFFNFWLTCDSTESTTDRRTFGLAEKK